MEERLKTESSIISFWLMAKPELASGVSAFREENSAAGGVFIYGIATAYKENRRETVAESPFYDYYPYGKQISLLATAGERTRPGFTGKEFDTEGQTDSANFGIRANYFGARYYDPEVAAWLSMDAAGQFWNPYEYVSNPLAYVDPDGNLFGIDDLILVAIIMGVAGGGYGGYEIGKAQGATGWEMFAYIMGGAAIGGLAGGAGASIGASLTSSAIAAGEAAGAAGVYGSTVGGVVGGYLGGFGLSTLGGGQGMYGGVMGGLSGGYGGFAGGVVGNSRYNWFGRTGAALAGGASGGGISAALSGENVGVGMARGAGWSLAGGILEYSLTPPNYNGFDIAKDNLVEHGDIIAFGPQGSSKVISAATLEDYSHFGVAERVDGNIVIRESQARGSQIRTPLAKVGGRGYTIVSRGNSLTPFVETLGDYNLIWNNCVINASRWTSNPISINPGAGARYYLNQSYIYGTPSAP